MESYTDFATVYDTFMDETPYDAWEQNLKSILTEYNIVDGLVLDLGCGTGAMTELLAGDGYDMIGVDLSEDMLRIAMEKSSKSGYDILYLCQDMREFELYGTVRAVVSVCDSVNYLLSAQDLVTTFKLVNNYLDPNGLFIFDFNTLHKYRDVIGDSCIAENRDDCSFIWDNYFDEESAVNEYEITFFVREGELFRRFEETHYQRGYELSEIVDCISQSGMKYIKAWDYERDCEPDGESERITVIAMEQGKGE